MNTNNSFLQAIKILIKESINSAPYNRTKQAMIVSNNGDNTYDIRFDGKLYTNIISYPNTRSLPLKHIVKVIIPNNQASQMYISAEGSPLIYYPVGSYYETSDSTFNPNNAWGGTWVLETEGQVHISGSVNGTYTITGAPTDTSDGGSKDAIIPYHNHGTAITQPTFTYPNHTHNIKTASPNNTGSFSTNQVEFGKPTGTTYTNNNMFSSSGGGNCTRTTNVGVTINHAGTNGNLADANMQPYIIVNRWHRTA